MKKVLAFMLALLLAATAAVSCSDNSDKNTSTTTGSAPAEETTSLYADSLPEDLKFDNTEIRILYSDGLGELTKRSLESVEDAVDLVDVAVYKRNLLVTERLGVKLTTILAGAGGMGDLPAVARTSITGGSDDYDVIGGYHYYTSGIASEGLLRNLNNLNYFNFDAPYWSQDIIDSLSYKDASYWATGDLTLRYVGGMYVTFINSTIYNNNFSGEDIYQTVLDGKWTLDKINEMISTAYSDLNGDQIVDTNDQLGIVMAMEDPIEGIMSGSNVHFSTKDANGVPSITFNNPHTVAFQEKLYNMLFNNKGTLVVPGDDNVTVMTDYSNGGVLFCINKLFMSELYLRDMEDDFYVVPVPKFDEAQDYYYSITHDGLTLFGVPITCSITDAAAATLEALSAESWRSVTPVYYEIALKTKYSRDDKSSQMIDLVREHMFSDFVHMYSGSISDIAHFFRNNCETMGTTGISSRMEKLTKAWNKGLEKLLKNLEKNEQN